ncbi:MAG: hypothetical protein IPM66_22700 [Acidobacteriota bacterium]|nr:MAG: hypothetical protein IPM66_22700 [Acidobacteriota bacterium]
MMTAYNPYLVDEIVADTKPSRNFFGLIIETNEDRSELHGYEVTLDGRVVAPSLNPSELNHLSEVEA